MGTRILFSNAGVSLGTFSRTGENYRKDFIREGIWTVSKSGDKLPVTKDRIRKWQKHFSLFRERGISVPLTVDHIRTTDKHNNPILRKLSPGMAEAKRGTVQNLFEEGGSGWVDVSPADQEAVTLMNRCPEVSLELEKDFVDGHGNYYDEAITAITLTPIPVIPGQKLEWERVDESDPVAVAASRDPRDQNREIISLTAEPFLNPNPTKPGNTSESSMNATLLSRARTLLSMPNDAEDAVHAKLLEYAEGRAAVEKDTAAKLKERDERITSLSRDGGTVKVITIQELAKTVDEDSLDMCARGLETRINALGARCTPAQRKMLLSRFVGDKDSRKVLGLSRKIAKQAGFDEAIGDSVVEIFEAADLTEMNKLLIEQSKTQSVKLNRAADPAAQPQEDLELTKRMTASANAGVPGTAPTLVM